MKSRKDAVERYMEVMSSIMYQLDKLKDAADNFFDVSPDAVNWSDVGTAVHVDDLLKEINAFLGGKENE